MENTEDQYALHQTCLGPDLILPNEVLEKVLVELPVKSLLRFKCVCKHWDAIIKDPQFIRRHYKFGGGFMAAITSEDDDSDGDNEDIHINTTFCVVSDTCYGLSILGNDDTGSYHIMNQATRQILNIPSPSPIRYISLTMCYDMDTNLFKLFCLYKDNKFITSHQIRCEVLILRSDDLSWRTMHTPEVQDLDTLEDEIESYSTPGAFHYLRVGTIGNTDIAHVISFGLKNDSVTLNTLLESYCQNLEKLQVCYWDGKLSFAEIVNENHINVLVLENHEKHQFGERKFVISETHKVTKEDKKLLSVDFIAKGKLLISLNDDEILVCDIKSGLAKKIHVEVYNKIHAKSVSLVRIQGMRPYHEFMGPQNELVEGDDQ